MFEYKVTWTEETEVPSIYQFETLKEARTFHHGLTEPGYKIPNCPKVYLVEKGRWENPPVISKERDWSLLFSILMGLWTAAWWYLFHQDTAVIAEEYLLISSSTMLATYLILLIKCFNDLK